MDITQVPAGYKLTDFGVLPEDWAIERLGSKCELITKGTTPTSVGRNFQQQGINFIKIESLEKDGTLVPEKVAFINKETHQLLKRSQLKVNDILFSIAGALGRTALVPASILPANTNQALAIIRLKEKGNLDKHYLFYYLNSKNLTDHIAAINVQAAQANLSLLDINQFQIVLPPLAEQQAIAAALGEMDALLASQRARMAKQRAVKQGLLQGLLSGKQRLPGFAGEWETKRLGELGELKNGINKSKEDFGFGSPFINLMDVFGQTLVKASDKFGLVNASSAERKMFSIKKGDVLFIRSSVKPEGVGLTSLVVDELPDTVYSGFLIRFRANSNLDNAFKAYCFHDANFRKRLIESSTVSANTNINQPALRKLEVLLPSLPEQKAIAAVLSEADAYLAALEAEHAKTQLLKQGMMQNLLTGKLRLV